MEGASGSVPWGELLIQGGYLPQQVRIFLHSSGAKGPSTALNEPEDSIKYYIVPSGAIREAVEKVRWLDYLLRLGPVAKFLLKLPFL